MGFVKPITQNTGDSHQTSPGYVLTFCRWENRSSYNYESQDPLDVRKPMVVYSDAINVSVSNTKGSLSPTLSATLKGGDINYSTAVHPGDFVLVNLLNWETDAQKIRDRVGNNQSINRYEDGFKGVFKIQTVRKNLQMAGDKKILTYTIHAAGFTEFNNVIYFNPAIAAAFREAGTLMFPTLVGDYYSDNIKTNSDVQIIMKDLFEILIGKNRRSNNVKVKNFGAVHFRLPKTLSTLLGRKMEFATELFNYYIGGWGNSKEVPTDAKNLGILFNPGFSKTEKPGTYIGKYPIQGNKEILPESWNNVTAWSILQSNMNSTMNEMYTCFRVDQNNNVMPTIILRQKPFTTEHFNAPAGYSTTKFFDIPRWKVSPTLLYSLDLGKDEAARMNFVQVFTNNQILGSEGDAAQQIAAGNFIVDDGDIQRNGLRPYVVTSNFDFPTKTNKKLRANDWAKIVSDWVIDGHLKESGTFVFQGIQEPICVGDNLEFDNVVYHIESVRDMMSVGANGIKTWRTTIRVSSGVDLRSNSKRPVYPQMENTDQLREDIEDWKNQRILPGFSDTQDVRGRVSGEELTNTKQDSFTLNPKNKKATKSSTLPTGEEKKPSKDS